MGNRMSSLPIAQYCSASGVLGDKHGAGRAAAVSTAFHALAAGEEHAADLVSRLSPEEQLDLAARKFPTPVSVGDVSLEWKDGHCEAEVVLKDGEEIVSVGHVDCFWIVDGIAYVADIKATDWSSSGVGSLQLQSYGLSVAEAHDCDAYCCGIWNATEGEWDWGEIHDLMDIGTMKIRERVVAAAKNTNGEYATGPHCHDCYQRLHCQEWLAPIANPETALAQVTTGDLTQEKAAEALLQVKAIKDLVKLAESTLKAYADRVGGIVSGDKVWISGPVKGRMSLDKKALEEDHPGLLDQYQKRGKDSVRYSWRKKK